MVDALTELKRRNPRLGRAMIKLDEGFSGGGNAIFQYPDRDGSGSDSKGLAAVSFAEPAEKGP